VWKGPCKSAAKTAKTDRYRVNIRGGYGGFVAEARKKLPPGPLTQRLLSFLGGQFETSSGNEAAAFIAPVVVGLILLRSF